MVYCTRCGTLNSDSATNCSNCGAPLIVDENRPYTRYERRRIYQDSYRQHRGGSGVGLLIAGLIIIIIGIAAITGFSAFWSYFWPLILVIIGIWVLSLAFRRNRRYRQAPPL